MPKDVNIPVRKTDPIEVAAMGDLKLTEERAFRLHVRRTNVLLSKAELEWLQEALNRPRVVEEEVRLQFTGTTVLLSAEELRWLADVASSMVQDLEMNGR